jgi:hypothetical protein
MLDLLKDLIWVGSWKASVTVCFFLFPVSNDTNTQSMYLYNINLLNLLYMLIAIHIDSGLTLLIQLLCI